jgi:hypothetical protein
MEIVSVILVVLIATLFWRVAFGPNFLTANFNDWLVLEWHKLNAEGTWDTEAPVHLQFVPIIGWKYNRWGQKHAKQTPITPFAYRVESRLDSRTEYETLGYWIRDNATCHISEYWSHGGDFWETLAGHATAGSKIEVHGDVPDSCRDRLSKILD